MRTRADIKLLLILCMVWPGIKVNGQNVAVKTNLLYDIAAYTANAGVEVGTPLDIGPVRQLQRLDTLP